MNPVSVLGLTASIIACIQLAQALSKEVGLSEHNRTDLERMLRTLRRFLASYQGLKNIAAIDESGGRFCLVKQAEQPWKESQEIINEVQQRLEEKNLFNQWIRGGVPGTGKSTNALCDIRDIKENAQRIEDHIRDLKDDALEIRHGISLYNQSINNNHTNIDQHTRDVNDSMQDIKCTIAQQSLDFETKEKIKARESKKKEVLQWLLTADPKTNHDLARRRFEPGTGSWFLQSNKHRNWKTSDNSFLWLNSYLGCDRLLGNSPDCFIAYYYFSFNETEKQNANNLPRSIFIQLLVKCDASLNDALAIFKDIQPTVPLKDMLKAVLTMPGTFYLILDAVDECHRGYAQGNRQAVCELLREVSS
ncbi:hypothetical protein ABEW05_001354 [Botrytis cinerea]